MDQAVVMKYGETAVSIPIRGAHRIETLHENTMREIEDLPPDLVREMNIISSPDIGELLRQIDFTGKDVYVVPFGGYVMPLPPQEKEK